MENADPPKEESLETEQPAKSSQAAPEPTAATEQPAAPSADIKQSKPAIYKKVTELKYLYLIVFACLLIIVGVVTFVSLKHKPSDKSAGQSSSLTAANLANLRGATTIVGDPKQILDIQSNAVFEGQILSRGEVNTADNLKVGKDISAASATLGNLQANGTLNVGGNTSLGGSLSVKSGLTVGGDVSFSGNLSAGQLTVGTLNLTNDLTITKHLVVKASVPNASAGSVGSGGTVTVSGSDTAGTVTVNTGSGPAAGNLVTVNFAAAFKSTPHVVVTPIGPVAGSLGYYITRSGSSFTIAAANAPPASSSFSFDYIVID